MWPCPTVQTDTFYEQMESKVYDIRNSKLNLLETPSAHTLLFRNSFALMGASLRNELPDVLKQIPSASTSTKKIKTHIFALTTIMSTIRLFFQLLCKRIHFLK